MTAYLDIGIVILLESLIAYLFYGVFCKRRNTGWGIVLCTIILLIAADVFVLSRWIDDELLYFTAGVILFAVLFYAIYEIRFLLSLVLSLMLHNVFLMFYFFLGIGIEAMDQHFRIADVSFTLEVVHYLGLIALLLSIVWMKRLFRRGRSSGSAEFQKEEWIQLVIATLMSLAVLTALSIHGNEEHDAGTESLVLASAVTLLFTNASIYYNAYQKKQKERRIKAYEAYQMQLENRIALYHTLSEQLNQQKKEAHEFKNRLLCIRSLIEDQKQEELARYLEEVLEQSQQQSNAFDTNHVIVNAILNRNDRICRQENIRFQYRGNDLSQLMITNDDLVILLSNLLNNAIEATLQSKTPSIRLKILVQEEETVLVIENSCIRKAKKEGDRYVSSKQHADQHGFGLQNIIELIEKYDGEYSIRSEEDQFRFTALIPHSGQKNCG